MNKTLHVPSCVLRETALAIATGPPSVATLQLPHLALPLVQDDPASSDSALERLAGNLGHGAPLVPRVR